ncbi:hypothetical protein JQ625_20970 [Bradyrhizobium diazoefficiens]|nr:hypothetical protein [Bradyrhizobium diazoefficiens]MBR0777311.1 hypothetical protein [Bradyrhizobium diazoefficiens]
MTSISSLSSHHHHASPLQRLQDELRSEVSSGAINASDQSALSSALGDIDSALQSSRVSDQEVSSGKLTDQQATELQGIFKAAFAHGPGAGGPPPANGPDATSSGSSAADLLRQFLDSLKSVVTDSTYDATGSSDATTAGASSLSGLLINDRI